MNLDQSMFMLAKHLDVQRKMFEEISTSEKDAPLPYLEAVIKESLRLLPSVPSFGRQTRQPFTVGEINCLEMFFELLFPLYLYS